ncbi:hypothetical protein MHYMCMPSP_00506 [Hyalomma marginatum]|uniref:Uncharacterized protein n=1 Tax=Hyalomma marginatum TaxID=34627 RepID=A0A8S4C1G6_9ACAR|nr:hypothetical protein MHYMCMPSP_00506 [Hyalomma marginatum]CAG7599114.1 hypothetical protein MHYMCMPASI_01069 [Hyalomma marginatum]
MNIICGVLVLVSNITKIFNLESKDACNYKEENIS